VDEFYARELEDRKHHHYPPFSRLIELTLKHPDKKTVNEASAVLAGHLRNSLHGLTILGPGEPMISKIRNQYQMAILIKIPRDSGHLHEIKQVISQTIGLLAAEKNFRRVNTVINVDPC
jgi:primosomal protein N' (replication factor Y)